MYIYIYICVNVLCIYIYVYIYIYIERETYICYYCILYIHICIYVHVDARFALSKFLVYSAENTKNNIESCAYLLGSQVDYKKRLRWVVGAIFIPLQQGDDVSCRCSELHDSAVLLEKCEATGMQVIGTIHTHPRFDAFLSSVDLHMHFLLQKDSPQAVAVVIDRCNQSAGFQLTERGMDVIRNCTKDPATFHPHEEVDGDGASVQACKYTHICTYIYNYIFTYIYIYIEGERDSHTIYTYIAGWKRLETLNLVSQSPNLCLNKCFYNLTSGLEGICV